MKTEYLLEREVDRVLAALMPQNELIMRVILHTGMRIGDVLSLRTDQLAMSGWYTEQKTGKKRRYGLPKPLFEAIKAQAGPVWAFSGRLSPLQHKTRQAVWADVKRASRAFRMPQNVGTHSARKVYAVELMERYHDIRKVQMALNHSSPYITAIYAMSDQLLQRRLEKRGSRSKRKPPGQKV